MNPQQQTRMHGIIISKPFAARSGHLAWADVPGVTYPAEAYADALKAARAASAKRQDDAEWVCTETARQICRYESKSACRYALHAAGVANQRGYVKGLATLYWERAGVQAHALRHQRAERRKNH